MCPPRCTDSTALCGRLVNVQRNFLVLVAAATLMACGARSSLLGGESSSTGDGGDPAGPTTGGFGGDGGTAGEGGGGGDGGEGGKPFDDCTDPDVTYIYLVTSSLGMYAYKPAIPEIEYRGQLNCDSITGSPFSMAVTRDGRAYVVYNEGTLWEADVTDASCEPTTFLPNQESFAVFGMGYAIDDDERGETLFVSDIEYQNDLSKGLASIDTETFVLSTIGPFTGAPGFRIELTGDGTELYAFILDDTVGGGHLARVDKTTGALSDLRSIPVGTNINAWHFAAWGGDFYFFTADNGNPTTTIRRYDPDTEFLEVVGTVPEPVVGAGASTCAPQF